MKKLFLAAFAVFAFASVNAQDFNASISGALPIGDAGDGWTFGVNLDVNYLWEVSDDFQAGVTAGVAHYFGDEISGFEIEDATFIPIGAAGRFAVSEEFTLGANLGYGIGIAPDGNDGGFYYSPRVQYGVSDSLDIVFAYTGISIEGGSFDAISLGVEFGL
ncbi:outer membrane beta-barrel protein [Winogradskyella ouciana]|uniref:Outer membrane protein beta-barrel domain-containing protein n=1 Tax=Winogradskyella ouciana TaxID=2608631 RepID=A0A7K1G9R7_9FLAO|nr:outer membrane beta-barrel protein [Winogradskyella ouciana]MTE25901.1 hypothetical protein [Winogradskyella ouciana]